MDIKNFKTYTNESGFNTPTNLLCKLCPKDVESGGTCSFFADGNNPGCLKEDYYIECTYDVVANRDSGGTIIDFPVTKLCAVNQFNATAMTIDGGESQAVATGHTFDTEGEHIVRFYKGSKFTNLGNHSFSACTRLINITGLGDITGNTATAAFEAGQFKNCTRLKYVDFSKNLKHLPRYCFQGCSSLETVGDLSGLEYLDNSDFYGCSSLREVNLSQKITHIGNVAFKNCTSLKKVGDLSKLSYTDSSAWTSGVFENCRNLSQKIILKNLNTISRYFLLNCSSVPELYIENCTYIEPHAFVGCTGLKSITLNCTTPPTISLEDCALCTWPFNDTGNCPIYVPEESVQAYKTATNWTRYASRIKPMKKYR